MNHYLHKLPIITTAITILAVLLSPTSAKAGENMGITAKCAIVSGQYSKNQYDWVVKNLNWDDTTRFDSTSTSKDWSDKLADRDVLLLCDTFAPSDLAPVSPIIKSFLEKGGLVIATSPDSARLVNLLFAEESKLKTERPSHMIGDNAVSIARWDRHSPLLCDPEPVTGPLFRPSMPFSGQYGYTGVSSSWNKLAWNDYDQPVLLERSVGKGLLVVCSLQIWDNLLFDANDWAPFISNACALIKAQISGTKRSSDIDRGRLQKLISDTGAVLVDGQPFFPLSIHHVASGGIQWANQEWSKKIPPMEQQVKEVASAGFNTFAFTMNCVDPQKVMDAAQENNLKVWPDLWGIDERVTKLKTHPALAMWNTNDEPDLRNELPQECENIYKATKSMDPAHPLSINIGAPMLYKAYINAGEIMGTDVYPVPLGPPLEIGFRVAVEYKETQGQRLLIPYIQAYDIHKKRQPNLSEYRFMTYDCIAQGARGTVCYAYAEAPGLSGDPVLSRSPLWPGIKSMNHELRTLTPFLTGHRVMGDLMRRYVTAIPSGEWLHSVLFNNGKQWALIAANASDKKVAATFSTIAGSPKKIEVFAENRNCRATSTTDSRWNDTFDPWQVHVYVWE